MSRRHDRQRRALRWERDALDIHPAAQTFDFVKALARWRFRLATTTGWGFDAPPFEKLVFGPVVQFDLLPRRAPRRAAHRRPRHDHLGKPIH